MVVRPILLGSGERLFFGIDLPDIGYACTRWVPGERAIHVFLSKKSILADER